MKSKILSSLLLCISPLFAGQAATIAKPIFKVVATGALIISPEAIVSRRALSDVQLFHHGQNFYALRGGKITKIENYDISKELRGISQEQIRQVLHECDGYFMLNQSSDGSYKLDLNFRLRGGGPVAGAIAYGVTKFLCWAGIIGAATASVAAASPAVAAGFSAFSAAAEVGVIGSAAVEATALTSASLMVAESAAATAVVTQTATASVGALSAVGGLVTGIESVSIGAGTFFAAIPFLP